MLKDKKKLNTLVTSRNSEQRRSFGSLLKLFAQQSQLITSPTETNSNLTAIVNSGISIFLQS